MQFFALAFITLVLSFLPGCASQKPAVPDWVTGDSAQYQRTQYLTGSGQAATQEEAKDSARADLAKIFEVAVMAESEDIRRVSSGSTARDKIESQSSQRVTTHTSQIISGIQIAGLWRDPATKSYHALAVLPRSATASALRQQINQLDKATGNHLDQSRNNSDLFLKIAATSQAIESQLARESLQKSLQVVDPAGLGTEQQLNSAKLKNDLDGLLKQVRIASRVSAGSPHGLAEMVAGALAKAGFMIETGPKPDFELQARMELTDMGFQEGWYWQRGALEITLSETATGRVRGTRRWNIKSNAPDKDIAVNRAFYQADAVLKQELRAAIIEMATGR